MVKVGLLITSKRDKALVSITIGICLLIVCSMSFLMVEFISKASAKATVSLP